MQFVAEISEYEGSLGRSTAQCCGMHSLMGMGRGLCQGGQQRKPGIETRKAGSGLPDARSTAPKLAHPAHSSLGSQKACAHNDPNFKAHDISLSSDLYVEWILQIKGNGKGEFANTYQYIKTYTQKAWCLFICVNVPYMCAPMCTQAKTR